MLDFQDLLEGAARGTLGDSAPVWKKQAAVCVVMAAGGYPGSYSKGLPISGLEAAEAGGAIVFHAGTERREGGYVTTGGRVLGVTALGDGIAGARANAYAAVNEIHWHHEHHRSDIALDAVQRGNG